jgi:hypothetical protein
LLSLFFRGSYDKISVSRSAKKTAFSPEGQPMPEVRIKDLKQYSKAIEVLTRVGGTWQGVGSKERFLLVTIAQYQALVEAKVVPKDDEKKINTVAAKRQKVHRFEN